MTKQNKQIKLGTIELSEKESGEKQAGIKDQIKRGDRKKAAENTENGFAEELIHISGIKTKEK